MYNEMHMKTVFKMFRRKSRAIVIARSSSCKIFNVTHYLKILVSTPNLKYLLNMTRCGRKTRGITLKAIFLELCPFLSYFLSRMMPSTDEAMI